MRDTIRGIVGKLRKGIDGYILVTVDLNSHKIHSFTVPASGFVPMFLSADLFIIGWYHRPIKMSVLRDQIERKLGGINV